MRFLINLAIFSMIARPLLYYIEYKCGMKRGKILFEKGKEENKKFEKEIKEIDCNNKKQCYEKIKNIYDTFSKSDNFKYFHQCKKNENQIFHTVLENLGRNKNERIVLPIFVPEYT